MEAALESAGFQVFLVDYKATNDSHFQTNKIAVWSKPGGIAEALQATRRAGLAAARADVVGHSMGGLLPRVYAKRRGADYLRTENFMKGTSGG